MKGRDKRKRAAAKRARLVVATILTPTGRLEMSHPAIQNIPLQSRVGREILKKLAA